MTHLSPEALAGYLDNALPNDDRLQVELHLASCVECRTELADVRRLQLRRRRRQWAGVLVPVAAAAAVLLMIAPPRQANTPSDIRSGPGADQPLGIVSPAAAVEVARGPPITFAWRSAGAGANYTITLQEEDGRVVWVSTMADTVAIPPDSVALAPGHTWFWFVDALLPDGQSRSTGVQRLMTRP